MSDVSLPSTIGASNIIGGVSEMRVRLLNRENLLVTPAPDNFALTGTAGSYGSGWYMSSGLGEGLKVDEYQSPFGRHAIEVEDDEVGTWCYLAQEVDIRTQLAGGELNGNTLVFTCWAKNAVAGSTDLNFRLDSLPSLGESITTGYVNVAYQDWTFVAFVATFSSAGSGETAVRLRLYPAGNGAADLGTARYLRPRLHVQREAVTGFPIWPIRDLFFDPWQGGRRMKRNGFGELPVRRPSVIPVVRARHPIANKSQMDQINTVLQHDAPLLVEPAIDSSISFLMFPALENWAYGFINNRAVGHSGEMTLEGLDPIMGWPEVARHYEGDQETHTTNPAWVMRIKP